MEPTLALPLVAGLIAIALLFDVLNGLHDAANSIATVVSTRVLSPQLAVAWAALQLVPWAPAGWRHPLWELAGDALGRPVGGSISIDPAGACSRRSMSVTSVAKRRGLIASLCVSSSSTKRDMCVPRSAAASATLIENVPTVGMGPVAPWIETG